MTNHEQDLLILSTDGTQIPATLVSPAGATSFVLLLHGITVDRNEYSGFYREAAQVLAANNIGSLRIDFRGHGKSLVPTTQFTINSQRLDTKSSVAWLHERFPSARLLIWGTSFGAPPAIFEASENELVSGVFLLAPVLDYVRTFLQPATSWARESFNAESQKQAETTGFLLIDGTFKIGLPLIKEMGTLKPLEVIESVPAHIVIVHGEEDSMVPYSITRDTVKPSPKLELLSVPRMDHGYIENGDDEGRSVASKANKEMIFSRIVMLASEK